MDNAMFVLKIVKKYLLSICYSKVLIRNHNHRFQNFESSPMFACVKSDNK
jgi:hypothetical protein